MKAVIFKDVSEKYRIKFIIEGKESWEDFWALKDVTFSVDKGQTLAFIGENGAGKSTILKLIAGLLKADKGEVLVRGRVSALLELGAGFYPEFTGRENLYLNASLFGITKNDTDSMFNKIVEFSGLGKFIDAQVKSYSQGMFVRLAFSVAIHMNPDILLIDDSLSVGDEDFQKKCILKILELKEKGKTIIFVTHDLSSARRLCTRGIFLRKGEIIKEGAIDAVISYYMETLGDREGIAIIQKDHLGVVFNNGRLIIRWEDKTITQDQGGYSSFFFAEHRFNSPTANWRVERKGENQIVAKGSWFNIPVVQIWNIRLLNDGRLTLKVVLEINDKSRIRNFQVELLFTKEYTHWLSSEQRGVFPSDFFHNRECELIYSDSIDKLACLKQSDKEIEEDLLPNVIVNAFGQDTESSCQILNSGVDITSRIIRLKSPIVYKADRDAAVSLSAEIKFIEAIRWDVLDECLEFFRQMIKEERQKIENKKMQLQLKKFVFGNGQFSLCIDENNFLHMYYAGEKITSGLGIRTSLFIGKEWKDTCTKEMWIEKISENHIQVHNLSWIDVPATQTWSFLMKEEDVIEMTMKMDVQSQFNIHEINVGVFFSRAYTKWLTLFEQGNFSDDFKVMKEVELKNKNIRAVGVVSVSFPTVVIDLSRDLKYVLRIWNSDRPYSCPLIHAVAEGMDCRKGETEFFKAIIRIREDKNRINEEKIGSVESEEKNIDDIFNKADSVNGLLYPLDGQESCDQLNALSVEFQGRLAQMRKKHEEGKIGIAVSRFNFFKLDKILKFYAGIFDRRFVLENCAFNSFPVRTIFSNFVDYLKLIKSAADSIGIRLVLKDKDLLSIIKTISRNATAYNGKQLLRLLGVICEHAFIGPRQIIINLFHRCNSSCVHCWFHNPNATLTDEYLNMRLDLDTYKKIVDDAQQLSVALIVFDCNGEPLLDERFPKMARYAKDKGIMVSFSTNGLLFDSDMANKTLFDFYVETITCSLPAATEETYALINPKRSKTTFQEIVRNMSYFIELRNSSGLRKPFLQMNHVIHALNSHELMKMAELDAKIGADIVQFCIMQKPDKNISHLKLSPEQINSIRDSFGEVIDFLNQRGILLDDSFLQQIKYGPDNDVIPLKYGCNEDGCPIGWFQSLVSANSEVSICHLKVVGSLKNSSLKQIWDSPEYHRYRIQAKYLKNNRDVTFVNGEKLYDEKCEQCEIVRKTLGMDNFFSYKLDKFV